MSLTEKQNAGVGFRPTFLLKYLQTRDESLVGKIFFAKLDPRAAWIDELVPAKGDEQFFPEDC